MIKKKSMIPNDPPVYREVIPQSINFAWTHPTHWLLGIFAAILFSSGALDVFWKFWNAIQSQGNDLFIGHSVERIWLAAQLSSHAGISWLPYIKGLLGLVFFFTILVAVMAFSCVCQGALVHAIGHFKANKKKSLKNALTVGSKALVPIAVLNLIIITFIWIARFGVSFPLAIALGRQSSLFYAVYVVSFIVFALFSLVLSIMQIYALNAMILNKASLATAFEHAWDAIRRHWLVTIETAIIQSLMIFVFLAVTLLALIVLSFPPLMMMMYGITTYNLFFLQLGTGIFLALTLIALMITGGFVVSFQYSTWTLMYKKFGEGTAKPKLHRLLKSTFG